MKKKLSALLCALCMAMALCLTAFAAGTPVLSATATRSGSTVTLTLDLNSDDVALQGLQCNVTYDTDKLEFVENTASAAGIYGVADLTPQGDGVVQVLAFNNTASATKDSGLVATLTFNVKEGKTGPATFGVENVKAPDENNNKTNVTLDLSKASVEVADSKPEVKEYTVTVNQTGEGTVTLTNKDTDAVIASGSKVEEGTNVVVEAEAATGYTLGEIEVNGAKVKSGDSLNITANTVINVTFTKDEPETKTYTVKVDAKNATIEVDPKAGTKIEAGTEVEITKAVANVGYDLKSIVVTNDTTGDPITVEDNKFKMPESNVTITAEVEAHVYNIGVANKDEHGTIEAPKTAAYNSKVTVTAKPEDGYELKTVTITYIDAEGKTQTKNVGTTFTMPAADVSVSATFAKKSSGGSTTTTTPSATDNKTTTVTATATATPAPTAQAKPAAAIPQTGDNANLALYAVLCVVSAMALGYVVYRKKANH